HVPLLLMLLCFLSVSATAQWYNPDNIKKKLRLKYEQGVQKAYEGFFNESLKIVEDCIAGDPNFIEAHLTKSNLLAELKNYPASVEVFEKAYALDSIYASAYIFPYAISLAGIGSFQKAFDLVGKYLQQPSLNQQTLRSAAVFKKQMQFAVQYAKDHPLAGGPVVIEDLGEGINSSHQEYYPSFSIDGKKMIFTRRVNMDEDFYESQCIDNVWQPAQPVSGKINTTLNEGAQCLSQDGNWLIFTGCNYPEGMGRCDLYISYQKKDGSWTEAVSLEEVNSPDWDSGPTLAADKQTLYFSSDRPGGFGKRDIWLSHRQSNGKWSEPENAGPTINTSGDESCPYIHPDNRTLYFISDGKPGYGSSDLFLSRRDSIGHWQEAFNLGFPYNTINEEGSLMVAADGKTAYFASDRLRQSNDLNIYRFSLRDDIQAARTTWIEGRVTDQRNGSGLPSQVKLMNLQQKADSLVVQTDENGQFLITLPEGGAYGFFVKRKGFLPYSQPFQFPAGNKDTIYQVNIQLLPLEKGASFNLNTVYFKTSLAELDVRSFAELDVLAALLIENPNVRIQINGHTDNVGKTTDNLLLSKQRANAVFEYLSRQGIDTRRMTSKGWGDTKPVSSNDTEEGKALNRRTEIVIQ
ncbi:MAG: OmpA family protein, partial [Ferruginibacter sp.]